jgi:isoleucyl-tRNA synthetase
LLAEDGRQMHKSWGNSIEFNDAADKMGVDTMRWLYCAQKPENDLLFGYHRAEDTRRRFIIPLWNVYSFFATYASLDNWMPSSESFVPGTPEGKTPTSDNPLDRWILSCLNQVIAQVTENFEDSDAYSATLAFERLLDDLSNWYVRRSRRRFWKSEQDSDKNTAYTILWHTLVKMTRALAPIIPFLTEVIYQNLVRGVFPQSYDSVHHTDWTKADSTVFDDKLVYQMDLARRIASLGLSARNNANLKVRQPLAKVLVHVREGSAELPTELVEIVADELNVKALKTITDLGAVVRYKVLPNNKLLGPRLGANFRQVSDLLHNLDPYQVAAKVAAGEVVTFELNGETVALTSEEILISTESAEGLAVAADKLVTVAIDTILTPELKAEGLAREIVRRIQTQRKNADFNIEDRITTWYVVSGEWGKVFTDWGEYIQSETLTTELVAGVPPVDAFVEKHKVEGAEITIGLKRN